MFVYRTVTWIHKNCWYSRRENLLFQVRVCLWVRRSRFLCSWGSTSAGIILLTQEFLVPLYVDNNGSHWRMVDYPPAISSRNSIIAGTPWSAVPWWRTDGPVAACEWMLQHRSYLDRHSAYHKHAILVVRFKFQHQWTHLVQQIIRICSQIADRSASWWFHIVRGTPVVLSTSWMGAIAEAPPQYGSSVYHLIGGPDCGNLSSSIVALLTYRCKRIYDDRG